MLGVWMLNYIWDSQKKRKTFQKDESIQANADEPDNDGNEVKRRDKELNRPKLVFCLTLTRVFYGCTV